MVRTAVFKNSTLALIRPHAVHEGNHKKERTTNIGDLELFYNTLIKMYRIHR